MTTNRRVLVDHYGPPMRMQILEGRDGGKLVVEGKIGHVDKPTANNRVYPRSVMEREIGRLQPRIEQGSVIGAVDHPGDGKCLGLGTPVLMADGRVLPVEQIVAGDRLMGPDGKARTVLATTSGTGQLYRIDPAKGDPWVCNDKHVLTLVHTSSGEIVDIPVEDYLDKSIYYKSRYKLFSTGVERFEDELPEPKVDPYFLGVWFGDGGKTLRENKAGAPRIGDISITTIDDEIKQLCEDTAARWELSTNEWRKTTGTEAVTIHLTAGRGQDNRLLRAMRDMVGTNVEIPTAIVRGSRETRLQFLAGLIDTDGHLQHNCFYITQKRADYAQAAHRIAKSLGLQAVLSTRKVQGYSDDYHTLTIWGDVEQIPTRLERKKAEPREQRKDALRTGFIVTSIGTGDYAGFELDGDGRFLLGDFTVNHNSRIREGGCIVRGLWIEDDGTINGKFEVVEEADAGRNLAAFLRRGAAIGMSSRGMGSTSTGPRGWDMVGEDFKLNTWDFVADPACHDAYPSVISEDTDGEGKPTGKLVVDPKEVTETMLRQHFPDAVRVIEQHAMRVASETAAEDTDDRINGEVESQKEEIYKKAIDELREDFAAKLVRALAEMRTKVEEEVRSDFASDPETAGAKLALKKIAEMVNPYAPSPDEKKVLDEKDAKIEELSRAADEQEQKAKDAESRVVHVEEKTRQLAFQLYVEQMIGGREDRESVRDLIGDIAACNTAEELKTRVESALTSIEEAQMSAKTAANEEAGTAIRLAEERASEAEYALAQAEAREKRYRSEVTKRFEALEERLTSALESKDEEVRDARARIEEQADMLERAVTAGTRAKLLAYASDRTIGHPNRESIMEDVRNDELTSTREIDAAASRSEIRAQEPGGPMERVRRSMSAGREHITEDERRAFEESEQAELLAGDAASQDLAFLGTSLVEQERLAGRMHRH